MWCNPWEIIMDKKLSKLLAGAIDQALTETDLTMQERVATGALKVWNDTRQNEPFAISEGEAAKLAFDAQRKETLARNKRVKIQVKVPDAIGYSHKDFVTFDNNVARLKLTIVNAPHLPKALKIVDKLVLDDVVKQSSLVLHKAMEAVGLGTGETWEADKRSKAGDSTKAREKRDADKVTPAGFTLRLKALIDEAEKLNIKLVQDEEIGSWAFAAAEPVNIDTMPDAAPQVMDADAIAAMMDMPQFQQAMAAFAVAAKK